MAGLEETNPVRVGVDQRQTIVLQSLSQEQRSLSFIQILFLSLLCYMILIKLKKVEMVEFVAQIVYYLSICVATLNSYQYQKFY